MGAYASTIAPSSRMLRRHPHSGEWKEAIGHVIVAFGTLERLMVEWAIALTGNDDLRRRHHKDDMKAIAPAVRRIVKAKKNSFPDRPFNRAIEFIDRAEKLIQSRNDVAHGWLGGGRTPNDPMVLLVAKRDQRQKLIFGVRDLGWVISCGRGMDNEIVRCREIAMGTCAYIPGAIDHLKAARIIE